MLSFTASPGASRIVPGLQNEVPVPSLAVVPFLSAFGQKGLLLYRDAPWDADQFAQATPYKEVEKFSTVHNLTRMDGGKVRVSSALVIKDIRFPTQSNLSNISTEAQVKVLNAAVADWTATVNRYPTSAKHLKPHIAQLQAEIAQFRAGKVKVDGVWTSKEALVAKRKKAEEDRRKVLAKLDEEAKTMGMLAEEWAGLDEAARKRAREAKLRAEEAQLQADEARRLQEEIEKQQKRADERAKMKPAERLATDTWITPPGLNDQQKKEYEEAMETVRKQLGKARQDLGYGKEAQRMVLKTPEYVYAFQPSQLSPDVQSMRPAEEEKLPAIILESAKQEETIEVFPKAGEPKLVSLITIPTVKSTDIEELANALSRILELCGALREVETEEVKVVGSTK